MEQNKIAAESPVSLVQPSANLEFRGVSAVALGWANFHCEFEAVRSAKSKRKYALKLFAKHFDDKPCFRFDSAGPAHMNEEMGQGLPARSIPTPHFHWVDSDGIMRARQTPPLVHPVESVKISSDPQLGTNHFCQVANLFSPSGGSIVLRIIAAEFDLSTADPLDGANLPP